MTVELINDACPSEYDLPREVRMTRRDFELFLAALEADEEPNERLCALFAETVA